ncbi:MAG: hypothetical protein QXK88_02600 [Desulfurococcaceae archaeon]
MLKVKVIELEKVKDLNKFISYLESIKLRVEWGSHFTLEDNSEVVTLKVHRNSNTVAYVVAHYITQYYKPELNSYGSSIQGEAESTEHCSEKWSIPVNPVYVIAVDEGVIDYLGNYQDEYPIHEGETAVNEYRSRNPNYRFIPRIIVARFIDPLE